MTDLENLKATITPDAIAKLSGDIIHDALYVYKDDDILLPGHLTCGEFRAIKGFQGSSKLLYYLIGVFLARLVRVYAVTTHDWDGGMKVLATTDAVQAQAVKLLQADLTSKLGEAEAACAAEADAKAEAFEEADAKELLSFVLAMKPPSAQYN